MPIYSYAELKGKIKVGDKVRAVIGRPIGCGEFGEMLAIAKDNSKVCSITRVDADGRGFCINGCYHGYHEDVFLELLTEEKTLDTVDVGDVVVSEVSDYEHTIIDTTKNGVILFLSRANDPKSYSLATTRQDLKDFGYTVKQSTPAPEPKEMTLDEVSKALGYPVRIKE